MVKIPETILSHLNRLLGLYAILLIAFLPNCAQGELPSGSAQPADGNSDSIVNTPQLPVPPGCIGPMATICNGTVVDTGGGCDAAPGINSCLNAADTVLALPPGVYLIRSTIQIQYDGITLSTQNLSEDTTTCMKDPTSKPCAVLRAADDFAEKALLLIGKNSRPVNRITVDHIALDGALEARSRNKAITENCGSKGYGRNVMEAGGANNTMRYSASVNALCGTAVGWAVAKTGVGSVITKNYIAHNGLGFPGRTIWSDGLTIGKVSGATITANLFQDSTDVDVVIGGATNSTFSGNIIRHLSRHSFAGFMLTNWSLRTSPGTAQWADFRGFDISNNTFNCNSRVEICVQIGVFPWFFPPTDWARWRTMGGTFRDNRIYTQLQGINFGGGGTLRFPFVMYGNSIFSAANTADVGVSDRKSRRVGKMNVFRPGAENFIEVRDGQERDLDMADEWHSIF